MKESDSFFIRENYNRMTAKNISDILKVPVSSVYVSVRRMGIQKLKYKNIYSHRTKQYPEKINFDISSYDIGWLTGLIDGEGCFSIHESNASIVAVLVITNVNIVLLNRVRDILKCGKVYKSRERKNKKGGGQIFQYELQSPSHLLSLSKLLIEHFIVKHEQAHLIEVFYKIRAGIINKVTRC